MITRREFFGSLAALPLAASALRGAATTDTPADRISNFAKRLRPIGRVLEYWLYYKSWNTQDYVNGRPPVRGNRKYGLAWSEPLIAYLPVRAYVDQPPAPKHLTKYGRFERPQLLLRKGRPAYLFTTTQGGRYETSTPFVFTIE